MSKETYTVQLNDREIQLILKALGKQPFEEVYELIEKIVVATGTPQAAKSPKTKKRNSAE